MVKELPKPAHGNDGWYGKLAKCPQCPSPTISIIHLPLCQFRTLSKICPSHFAHSPNHPLRPSQTKPHLPLFQFLRSHIMLIAHLPVYEFSTLPQCSYPTFIICLYGHPLLSYFDNEFPTWHAITMIHNVHIPFPTFLKPIALIYYILS